MSRTWSHLGGGPLAHPPPASAKTTPANHQPKLLIRELYNRSETLRTASADGDAAVGKRDFERFDGLFLRHLLQHDARDLRQQRLAQQVIDVARAALDVGAAPRDLVDDLGRDVGPHVVRRADP